MLTSSEFSNILYLGSDLLQEEADSAWEIRVLDAAESLPREEFIVRIRVRCEKLQVPKTISSFFLSTLHTF